MLATQQSHGRLSQGQAFRRFLLSCYDPRLTLGSYIDYFELKNITQTLKKILEKIVAANKDDKDLRDKLEVKQKEAEDEFFKLMNVSMQKVRKVLHKLDSEALKDLAALKRMSEAQIAAKGETFLSEIYEEFDRLADYRQLNCDCVQHALAKLNEQCAVNNLELQCRIHDWREAISKTPLSLPYLDISHAKDFIVSAYGMVFGKTFAEVQKVLECRIAQDLNRRRRVVTMSTSAYFQHKVPFRAKHGNYAVRLFAGSGNKTLAKTVAQFMQIQRTRTKVGQFSNGEVSICVDEAVRGDDCFIVQSLTASSPYSAGGVKKGSLSTAIIELILFIQTLFLASAERVTAVIPYLAYTKHTAEIAAIAEMLGGVGCKQIVTVDMYKGQIEGFFENVPVANITARWEFVRYLVQNLKIEGHRFNDIVIVAPDGDTVARARSFADTMSTYCSEINDFGFDVDETQQQTTRRKAFIDVATVARRIVNKKAGEGKGAPDSPGCYFADADPKTFRTVMSNPSLNESGENPQTPPGDVTLMKKLEVIGSPINRYSFSNKTESSNALEVIGNVAGKLCIIVDCVIDEGYNMVTVVDRLKVAGAKRVKAVVTHGLFSGDAVQRIIESPLEELIISDSVDSEELLKIPEMAKKLRVIPLAPLLSEAMEQIHADNQFTAVLEEQ